MGFFDRAKNTTNQEYTTFNVGLQDSDGSIANVGGTVIQSDQGAIAAGRDLGLEALAVGERNLDVAAELTRDILYSGADQNDRVAQTLGDAARGNLDFAARALDFGERSIADAYDFNRAFLDEGTALVDRVGSQFLGAVERFQARESDNADARLQDVTRTGLIGMFVLGGLAIAAYAYTKAR